MPTFEVEELYGESVVASETVDMSDAKRAAERVAGWPVSARALQQHWFRVVDEAQGTVHEFSVVEDKSRDFSK
jgi:hypothetical protein